MSIKVGITGGIGTGKSFVSKIFKTLGVPFYDADLEAKLIMNKDAKVREALIGAFGSQTYFDDGSLNRRYLSEQVFNDNEKLALLNSIVHPAVIQDSIDWSNRQHAPYILKEAALLYESGSYKNLDYTILVTAPEELRIQRVMQRDHVDREEVLRRMAKQMPEAEKLQYADFLIHNDEKIPLLPQVLAIHNTLIHT
ncbi:dephospho-CoA kinase [Parapusillimonas sp. SGNA-6]|uniref:dephospho-CoA kinase n=1 Tax=Parapedobacter sp. SGR-10 TaxID=2710879 RepID=UPI0013D20D6B|nr:dephospho-CoA kinase [Parapedobacter sp. SGR-10]NGF56891.1 dephospho-CoA kinase [Parapedobacter sp. SGR-10]NGM90066.1 dephospho-CoA kinase [Parapusillimonas sp. SGNA-6]